MKNLAGVIALTLLTAVMAIGCKAQQVPDEPPEISIKIDNMEIEGITAKNEWDGKKYDREDTFVTILKEDSGIEVPYIEIGKIAEISFENNPPKNLYVYDMIIREDGRRMYDNRVTEEIPIKLNNGRCTFEIKKNMASVLSSYYEPNKKDLRGIRMIADWGSSECEYAFVIQTDAY